MVTVVSVDKRSGESLVIEATQHVFTRPSVAVIKIARGDIRSMSRQGNDLQILTHDGKELLLKNYFDGDPPGRHDLVLEDSGQLWWVKQPDLWPGHEWLPLDSVDPLLASDGSATMDLLPLALLGGMAAGVLSALAGNEPPAPTLSAPSVRITPLPDGSFTVTGRGTPGSTIKIRYPDGNTESVKAGPDGRFEFKSPPDQPSGDIVVHAVNPEGGRSPDTRVRFEDTTPPDIRDVRVTPDPGGGFTIEGETQPGSSVRITYPDGSTGSTTAGPDGKFVLVSPPSQPSGDITLEVTDRAGNVGPGTSLPYVDNTPPQAPSVGLTTQPDGSVIVSGTGEPGSTITVHYPDGTTDTIIAGPDGSYQTTSPPDQPSGNLRVNATDPEGNTSPDTTVPFVDSTPPDAPTVQLVTQPDGSIEVSGVGEPGSTITVTFPDGSTGTVVAAPDGSYQTTSPPHQPSGDVTVNATDPFGNTGGDTTVPFVDAMPPDAPSANLSTGPDGSITVDGNGEPGSTITVNFPDGSTDTAVAGPDGSYQIVSPPGQPSGDVTVNARDADGNQGPDTIVAFTDTTPPTQTAVILAYEDNVVAQTGSFGTGTGTNDTSPLLSGSLSGPLQAGDVLQVLRDGLVGGNATIDMSGMAWTYQDAALLNGETYAYTVQVVDAAGNAGTPSASFSLHVDTDIPATPTLVLTDDQGPLTGTLGDGSSTDDTTPTLSGTAEPDSTLRIVLDGVEVGTTTADGAGNWSFTLAPLADGPHTLNAVTAVDAAGNVSASETISFSVDTSVLGSPTLLVSDDTAPQIGAVPNNGFTNDTTPTFSGNADPGNTVSIVINGAPAIDVIADGAGAWSYTPGAPLTDGPYTVTVSQTNGVTVSPSGSLSFTVDTASPLTTSSILSFSDNTGSVQNPAVASGSSTDDTTPVLSGSLSAPLGAADTVQIFLNGVLQGTASVSGTSWVYAQTAPLPDGPHTYTARVVDGAGNTGPLSPDFDIVVDLNAPSVLISDNEPGVTNGPVTYTFQFDKDVFGFDATDIQITNGTAGLFTAVNAATYTLVVNPPATGAGTITVSIAAGAAVDDAGNSTPAASNATQTYANAPTGSITVNSLSTADTTPAITGTFSGARPEDLIRVTVNGQTFVEGTDPELTRTSATTWRLALTGVDAVNVDGTSDLTLNVVAELFNTVGAVADASNNELTVYRDVQVTRSPDFDYLADTTPAFIGVGRVGAGEQLVVEIRDAGNQLVRTFTSAPGGGVTLDLVNGSWSINDTSWGANSLSAGDYTVNAYAHVGAGNTGGQASASESFSVVQPQITAAVVQAGDQTVPKAYSFSDGGYMLVWASSSSSGSNNYDLFAQRYTADGAVDGARITLANTGLSEGHSYNNLLQYTPQFDVAVRADNSFTVLYASNNGTVLNIGNFDANGVQQGATTAYDSGNTYELDPSFVVLDDGRSVALWASGAELNYNMWQQKFNANGTLNGVAGALTTGFNLAQGFAYDITDLGSVTGMTADRCTAGNDAAYLGGTQYAMVFMSAKHNATLSTRTDIFVRVMDYDNAGFGGAATEIKVNTFTQGYQIAPNVVRLKEGGFITVWASNHSAGTANGSMDAFDVYARRFAHDTVTGTITALDATEVRVNTTTNGVNGSGFNSMIENLDVAALAHGGYVVVWSKMTSTTRSDIYSQAFDAAGNKLGGETLVSTGTENRLDLVPKVSALEDGGYVVTWNQPSSDSAFVGNFTGDVMSVIVNADGSIRGIGDAGSLPPTASYLDGAGTLVGTAAVDTLDGKNGATEFDAGAGNDYLIVYDTSFISLTGGIGLDTLVWNSAASFNLGDLTAQPGNRDIEVIHLGDRNANTLTITDVADVLDVSSTTDVLVIQGGSTDAVDLTLGNDDWRLTGSTTWRGETYAVYGHADDPAASLWIQQQIAVI